MREGQVLKIDCMEGEPAYTGRIGTVERIDDMGQIHGTWGGCAIIPGEDIFHEATAAEIEEWEREKAKEPSYAPRKDVVSQVPCEITTRARVWSPSRQIAGSVKVSRNDDPNGVRILGLRDGDCREFVACFGGVKRLHGLAIEICPVDTGKDISKEILVATVRAILDFEEKENCSNTEKK